MRSLDIGKAREAETWMEKQKHAMAVPGAAVAPVAIPAPATSSAPVSMPAAAR
jgi:hypothetical protein